MKTLIPSFLLIGLLPVLSAKAAVNPAIVPADSRWIVYADFNALRETTVGKELVAMTQKAQAQNPIGINIEKVLATVGTITAYGSNFSSDPASIDGTLIMQGTEDLRKITESLVLQATLASPQTAAESKDFPFPAYSVKASHGDVQNAGQLFVAFPPEPIVIVSKSRAQVLKARDLFKSGSGSLSRASGSLKSLLPHSQNAYLFAASVVPPEAQVDGDKPHARILRMTHSGAISLGEQGGNTFAHIELVASSDEMADKAMKIVQGMTAMLSLAESNDRQLAEFMNSVAVNRNGNSVTLDLSYASERLVQMVRSLQPREPRVASRGTQGPSHIAGKAVAQWNAEPVQGGDPDAPAARKVQTIENVELKNGTVITLGRRQNGGQRARFESIELVPASGGPSLSFKTDFMRQVGPQMLQCQNPGPDGVYTLKVTYLDDPTGKAKYAVSVRDPSNTTANSEVEGGGSPR